MCKKRCTNNEIINYISREKCILSDDITFFVEDRFCSDNNDFKNRNTKITDMQIKFYSGYCINDWSVHLLNVNLCKNVNIRIQNWGGVNFKNVENYFVESYDCFTVHKYHSIISENNTKVRVGCEEWLLS